ncbi:MULTISPECIES: hypothetical protein [unclassified Streptomyces]|uniref:hypothetical protein n=1 Tax=Streptomyces sp. NPDC058441 TaxID=3346502 RepID=UPI00366684BC
MLLRLAYLTATTTVALLRLVPMSDRKKDIERLALRLQLLVLQRQVGKPAFNDTDRVKTTATCSTRCASSNPSTTGTGHTGPWIRPPRSARYPNQSSNQGRPRAYRSIDESDSAERCISTNMRLEQAG